MKRFKFKPIYLLLTSLVLIAAILFVTGIVLKRTAARGNPIAQDINPLALPLAAIQDHQLLMQSKRKDDAVLDDAEKQQLQEETRQEDKIDALIPKLSPLPKEPPKPHEVDLSYFDDALFIGDSRTVGHYLYAPIGNADYFASTGMSVFGARSTAAADTGHGGMYLSDMLASKQYGKIYVMLGVNECGYGIDGLREAYTEFITYLRDTAPDAKIIIMANLSISQEFSSSSTYVTLANITDVNNMLSELQDREHIFFIDVNPLFTDENGYLLPEYTWDGVHPYADVYADWANFIIKNGI